MKLKQIVLAIFFSLAIAFSFSSLASGDHEGGHESESEKSEQNDCKKDDGHTHTTSAKHEHPENDANKCNESGKTDSHTDSSH